MHPGYMGWWRRRRATEGGEEGQQESAGECGSHGGWRGGYGRWAGHWGGGGWGGGDGEGESFGVRRPLRFLAYKLDLDESQVGELAKVLNDLKTERAQASVDNRRALASFADAISGETFDEKKADEAADARVKTAESLKDAVVKALGRIHGILHADQRERLAYLIRTGVLTL